MEMETTLYIHAFGQASMLLLLLWEGYQVCGRFGRGKALAISLAGLAAMGLLLVAVFSGYGRAGHAALERGDVASRKGNRELALAEYTEAIRLDPNYARAYENRARAYRDKHDPDKAISDCTKAIQLDPKNAGTYFLRGLFFETGGDLDKAIADFTEAIRLDPTTPEEFRRPRCVAPEAYYKRGTAYASQGQLVRAAADFTEAIRFTPQERRNVPREHGRQPSRDVQRGAWSTPERATSAGPSPT